MLTTGVAWLLLPSTDRHKEVGGGHVRDQRWFVATPRLRPCRVRKRHQRGLRLPLGSHPPLAPAALLVVGRPSRVGPLRGQRRLPSPHPTKVRPPCDGVVSASAALPPTPARQRRSRLRLPPPPTRTSYRCPPIRLLMQWSLLPRQQRPQQQLPLPLGCVHRRGVFPHLVVAAGSKVLAAAAARRQRALMLVACPTGGPLPRQQAQALPRRRPTRRRRRQGAARRTDVWQMLSASAASSLGGRHRVQMEPRRLCGRAWTGGSRGRSATAPRCGAPTWSTPSAVMAAAVADLRLGRSGKLPGSELLQVLPPTIRRGSIASTGWVVTYLERGLRLLPPVSTTVVAAAAAAGQAASFPVYAGSGGGVAGVAAGRPSPEQGAWRLSRLTSSVGGGCFVGNGEAVSPFGEDGDWRGRGGKKDACCTLLRLTWKVTRQLLRCPLSLARPAAVASRLGKRRGWPRAVPSVKAAAAAGTAVCAPQIPRRAAQNAAGASAWRGRAERPPRRLRRGVAAVS